MALITFSGTLTNMNDHLPSQPLEVEALPNRITMAAAINFQREIRNMTMCYINSQR